eukprot:11228152-Lingulodinium_polyedra.AAC.1
MTTSTSTITTPITIIIIVIIIAILAQVSGSLGPAPPPVVAWPGPRRGRLEPGQGGYGPIRHGQLY